MNKAAFKQELIKAWGNAMNVAYRDATRRAGLLILAMGDVKGAMRRLAEVDGLGDVVKMLTQVEAELGAAQQAAVEAAKAAIADS